MKIIAFYLFLLLFPPLAHALCEPEIDMTKGQVLELCGPPDYAEIIQDKNPDTALPFTEEDLSLLKEEYSSPVVVWHYAPFEEEKSRMVLFRAGVVVRCCQPRD